MLPSKRENDQVKIKIMSKFGTFSFPGKPETSLNFESFFGPVEALNTNLTMLKYTVRTYDAREITDYINVQIVDELLETIDEILFPIRIRRKPVPILSFRESNVIAQRVTIVTKVYTIIYYWAAAYV